MKPKYEAVAYNVLMLSVQIVFESNLSATLLLYVSSRRMF